LGRQTLHISSPLQRALPMSAAALAPRGGCAAAVRRLYAAANVQHVVDQHSFWE